MSRYAEYRLTSVHHMIDLDTQPDETDASKKQRNKSDSVEVEIDLALSAYANAEHMYAQMKQAHSKELKVTK